MLTSLKLNGLDEASKVDPGKPLYVDIDLVIEDPHQPRKDFPEKQLQELADDIKERGVKNPVSVKPMNNEGFYILNAGARRRRAALIAGLSQIPLFIDNDYIDYDQVNENEQRQNLSPMEMAIFIKKRLDAGDKAADIGRKLRRDDSYITHHKALTELQGCLATLYRTERCQSAYHLYELKKLYDVDPDQVSAWCSTEIEISRRTIADLKAAIYGKPIEVKSGSPVENVHPSDASSFVTSSDKPHDVSSVTKAGKDEDPSKIKKPVLRVKHGKKAATLLIDRCPEKENHVFIRYEGGTDENCEVPCESIRLVSLVDAR